MHAALLCGADLVLTEREMLRQLIVGLLSEGVRVTRVTTQGVTPPGGELAGSVFGLPGSVGDGRGGIGAAWWPGTRRQWGKLAEALDEADVSLLVATDGDTWDAAVELGRRIDLPVMLCSHDRFDARFAPRLFRTLNPTRCLIVADSAPIADTLREATNNLVVVEHVPPGVHLTDRTPRKRAPDDPLCVVLSTDGPLDEDYLAALEGLALHAQTHPSFLVLLEGSHPDTHATYKHLRRLGLLGTCTFAPKGSRTDDLLLEADAVLHPQPLARSRSVTLAAMAHALPVIAVDDLALDTLIDDHTAWVLDENPPPTPEAWAEQLARLQDDPEAGLDLGKRAQEWVREEHLFADHLARFVHLCRQLAGEPIAFPG